MHKRQASGFSAGSVDDDGFIVHTARGIMRTATASVRHSGRRSSGFRGESVRRSVLSQTSHAAASRGLILPAGGIGSSVFNLCSATLGAGVLALPKCGMYSGWLLTAIYVTCSGIASAYAIIVLVMVSGRTGYMSYEEMSLKILGSRRWVWLSVILIALLCFGTAVGYIIAIGDVLDPFRHLNGAPEWLQGSQGRLMSQCAWWLCFFLPVSLPKHVNALRMGSLCGVFSVTYLLIMMSVHYGQNEHKPTVQAIKDENISSLFSLPIIMFGYGCQVNTFEIYREMYKPSTYRMSIVAIIALSLCSTFYILAGVIGYLDFGMLAKDNILDNFAPTESPMAAIAFVGMSITVSMAFPLCVFPTRDAIEFLIWPPSDNELERDVDAGLDGAPHMPSSRSGSFSGRGAEEGRLHAANLANQQTSPPLENDTTPAKDGGGGPLGSPQPRVAFNPVDSIREWNHAQAKQNPVLSSNKTVNPDAATGAKPLEDRMIDPDEEAENEQRKKDQLAALNVANVNSTTPRAQKQKWHHDQRKESSDGAMDSSLLLSGSNLGREYGSVSSIIKKDHNGASPNAASYLNADAIAESTIADEAADNKVMSENQRRMLVIIICVLILGAGLFIPNITTAFGVIGGLCIGPIGYSIPAAFAIKSGKWTKESVGYRHIIGVYILFGYGVVCATVGTGVSVYSIYAQSQ